MKNNNGFGKFEVLTIIVLMLIVFCILSMNMFGGVSKQKLETMKKSSISFSSTITTNIATFHNTETVYLQEAIDEKLISPIKSPIGGGYCSAADSYVELIDGMPYVTLNCNNILIEKENFSGSEIEAYKVSKWMEEKKKDDMEERVLYNCKSDDKEIFDRYYEELYFVYEINKKYNTNYYFSGDIKDNCKVVSKTFYRTKELIK